MSAPHEASPFDGKAPDRLWHEAHPGHLDAPLRICWHAVTRATERYLYVQRDCRRFPESECRVVRIERDRLAAGSGASTCVVDRDHRGEFRAAAWFFDGPVPASPHRCDAWLRERARVERAAKEAERQRAEAHAWARQNPPRGRYAPPGGWDQYVDEATRRVMTAMFGGARTVDPADLRALGLDAPPDAAGLLVAWRTTAKRTHPDAGGTSAAFIAAREAFERLQVAIGAGATGGGR